MPTPCTATLFRLVAETGEEIVALAQTLPWCAVDPASIVQHPAGGEWSVSIAVHGCATPRIAADPIGWASRIIERLRATGQWNADVAFST